MNSLHAALWLLTGALIAAWGPAEVLARPWPWSNPPAQPVREQTPHPAVARIIVPEQGGATSYGSGTLVDVHGEFGLVVTNWHVVRDAADKIEVVFPSGFRSFARALKVDANWDLAALVVWRPEVEPVPIATVAPRPGDSLMIAGYGSGTFRAATGRCTQYFAPDLKSPKELVEVSVQARHGDSGGPILNERGELAGVLFGASHGTTMGSYAGRVRGFLASIAPDLGSERTQIAAQHATTPGAAPSQAPTPLHVAGQVSAPTPSAGEKPWRSRAGEPSQTVEQPLASVPRPSGEQRVPPESPRAESFARAPQEHQPWPRRESSTDRDWSEFVQLSENPPGRAPRYVDPPPGEPSSVAALSAPADAVPQVVTWTDLAGETIFDQVKSVLALIGGFAVVYLLLRACGG